jgi:hypothetical protein
VENIGDVTATDVDILELLDPAHFDLLSVNPPAVIDVPTLSDAMLILWIIPEIVPGEVKLFSYQARLNPSVSLGSSVTGGPASVWNFPLPPRLTPSPIIPPTIFQDLPDNVVDFIKELASATEELRTSLEIAAGCMKNVVDSSACVGLCGSVCVPCFQLVLDVVDVYYLM